MSSSFHDRRLLAAAGLVASMTEDARNAVVVEQVGDTEFSVMCGNTEVMRVNAFTNDGPLLLALLEAIPPRTMLEKMTVMKRRTPAQMVRFGLRVVGLALVKLSDRERG